MSLIYYQQNNTSPTDKTCPCRLFIHLVPLFTSRLFGGFFACRVLNDVSVSHRPNVLPAKLSLRAPKFFVSTGKIKSAKKNRKKTLLFFTTDFLLHIGCGRVRIVLKSRQQWLSNRHRCWLKCRSHWEEKFDLQRYTASMVPRSASDMKLLPL